MKYNSCTAAPCAFQIKFAAPSFKERHLSLNSSSSSREWIAQGLGRILKVTYRGGPLAVLFGSVVTGILGSPYDTGVLKKIDCLLTTYLPVKKSPRSVRDATGKVSFHNWKDESNSK